MPDLTTFATRHVETARHRTAYLEAGPANGPLMIFLHGWPELGLSWRPQIECFAARGWRCIAPDLRGYGGSSVPTSTGAYAIREIVADMIELHDAHGGAPAVWVGHDWGSPVAWAIASHHADRCRGVVNLTVPYVARGFAMPNLLPLVDRKLYPADEYPAGQWDYWWYYREHFAQAAADFEADIAATLAFVFQPGSPHTRGKPAGTASVRARGGWFGPLRRAPESSRESIILPPADFDAHVLAFTTTGFRGADAWYLNDDANLAYAAAAPNFGRISVPTLFIHAEQDTVCDTTGSRLAEPMREDCDSLVEVTTDGGHELMLDRPDETNGAIDAWVTMRGFNP